jgi:methylmalonyl-CoA mutase N-terminal domain/subunit
MKIQKEQIAFLKKIKDERSQTEVVNSLSLLRTAAQGEDNLLPYILDAVRKYASIGEICNTLRGVFGEYKESVFI